MKATIPIILFIIFGHVVGFSQQTINKSEYIRKGGHPELEYGGIVYYHDSLFTGTAIERISNGQIICEEHYEKGKPHGLWKHWYKTGEKKFEGRWNHGEPEGPWIIWKKDGTITNIEPRE